MVSSATNPCYHIATDPDKAPRAVAQARTSPGPQAVGWGSWLLTTVYFFPSVCLQFYLPVHAETAALLSLLSATTRLHIVVAPTADGVTYSVMHGLKRALGVGP